MSNGEKSHQPVHDFYYLNEHFLLTSSGSLLILAFLDTRNFYHNFVLFFDRMDMQWSTLKSRFKLGSGPIIWRAACMLNHVG